MVVSEYDSGCHSTRLANQIPGSQGRFYDRADGAFWSVGFVSIIGRRKEGAGWVTFLLLRHDRKSFFKKDSQTDILQKGKWYFEMERFYDESK